MKRALAVMVIVGGMIFGFALGAQAAAAHAVLINIPFAFQAGDQMMPAGDYLFEFPSAGNYASGSLVRISTQDGTTCQNVLTNSVRGVTSDTDWHVTFTKYGDSYFFARIRNSEFGAEVSKTRKEKQLATEYMLALKPVATLELKASHTRAK